MGQTESTPDQHGATAETVGDRVLNVVTAPLAACCRCAYVCVIIRERKRGDADEYMHPHASTDLFRHRPCVLLAGVRGHMR